MGLFSRRQGYVKANEFQRESLSDDLRTLIWNEIYKYMDTYTGSDFFQFAKFLWDDYLKNPADNFPLSYHSLGESRPDYSFIKAHIFSDEWYLVLDICEVMNFFFKDFGKKLNKIFEYENFAYRFVGKFIVEITSEEEIKEIENAINNGTNPIKNHLNQALKLLSDKKSPDYRNSIKESISAVEAFIKIKTGESTLGRGLKSLEKNGVHINPILKDALEKLYGYTNAEGGIRHSLMDASSISQADAKFMMIQCSAFINYMKAKSAT